jgi:hypothetical protein
MLICRSQPSVQPRHRRRRGLEQQDDPTLTRGRPVLHIATVHYGSPRWIEIQGRYLRKHLSIPYRTWTSLQEIDPSYGVHFDRVIDQAGGHAGKLNNLAAEITHEADDSDLLMFLDGDAFPIADPLPLIEGALERAPLVAVRRDENLDDRQPHPSFCVTTVGTWRSLPGDWSPGHRWQGPEGRRPTDVGANLLRVLELTGTPWVPVLRSNRIHMDPLLCAIYGEAIYHHGAGFRRGGASKSHYYSAPKAISAPDVAIVRTLARRIDAARMLAWRLRRRGPQILESKRVYERIDSGGDDWLEEIR